MVMDRHEETTHHLGDKPGERLFAVLHRPARPRRSHPAVVICAPFAWEKVKAHRSLVALARHLNDHGFTALRFDYQGQGDSEGEFDEETFDRMTGDTVRAVRWVQERVSGSPQVALLGLRLGATVAAAAGARLGSDAPLLLWEPVVALRDYLYDYLRMNLADQSMMYKEIRFDRDQLVQQILAGDEVRVDGFVFSKPLWEGAEEVTLERFLAGSAAPCLLVQIDRGRKPKPPRKELRPLLEAHFGDRPGRELVHILCSSLFWLQFTFHRPHEPELFDRTVAWLEHQLGDEAETLPPGTNTSTSTSVSMSMSTETNAQRAAGDQPMRPVSFSGQDGNRLCGIFHPGAPERESTCLVLLNSGLLPRYCYHRHYVKLARYLAPLGISVLRYDASGLGDAEGDFPPARVEKHWHAIQRGFHVPDARAAITFAREKLGARRVLLAGACGGATTALLTAAAEPAAVDSCVLIAMPVVFSDPQGDQGALHPFEAELVLQSYWRKLTDPRALLRLLAGRSDYRLIFESIYRPLRRRLADLLGRPPDGAPRDQVADEPERPKGYNLHLEQAFGRYISAGGRVLIVMARFDRETADFEQLFEPAVLASGNPFQSCYRLVKVEGASHTFAEAGKEELLFEEVKEWIAQRIDADLDERSAREGARP